MIAQLKPYIEAIGSALLVVWGLYVEWRLHLAQVKNEDLQTELNDAKAKMEVHNLSDSSLVNELVKDIGGGSPSKPKAG